MKTYRIPAVLLALIVAGAFTTPARASVTAKTKVVSFKGSYSGTASLLIEGSSLKILAVNGTGTASLVGASTLSGTGKGVGANGSCVPFTGKGKLKGSAATISFTVNSSRSQGCSSGQSGPVTVTVTGTATVTGGTGKATGAKGTLTYKGTLNLPDTSGSQSGTFSGTVSGKVTVAK